MSVDVDPNENKTRAERSIRKSGNSYVVSIPPEILQSAGISEGDKTILEADIGGETIEIRRNCEVTDQ
ncbi:AbrB/MazE/SpoVT family DNA-binding domain-containing protein [Natronolimnohabitans sp. A-GB9]|uniref:AbrB/MazE/SpoVT family DNA-binding domain-containing protein n=1 Tax=Natronolimnohabitans sp. A-GB9 TaxID=3069757 RepID=UPI0027B3B98B|nr:AbrB/MazE/SpoVT family DNA-binding domain-containing protein [Natronolimnohabitans sp. A-GB9]MDQ2052926.1 AbrB/MazE/SpoVT family DNA-binding domain-containing protein [Natronolimnohabitans sp. A-GB9]